MKITPKITFYNNATRQCWFRPPAGAAGCAMTPYLGTGMYFTFLELRSVTSRYAAVIGGVTSERATAERGVNTSCPSPAPICRAHLLDLNSDLWGRSPSGAPCRVEAPGPPDWPTAGPRSCPVGPGWSGAPLSGARGPRCQPPSPATGPRAS